MRGRKLAVVLSGLLVAGTMAVAAPTQATHRTTDLNFRGTFTEFQQDRNASGRYEVGDRLDFDFKLRDVRDHKRFAGDGDGECVVTEVVFGEVFDSHCHIEFDLIDGRLWMDGHIGRRAFEGRQTFSIEVVDGSRHYYGMTGKATFFADDEWRGDAADPRNRECDRRDKRDRKKGCRGHEDIHEHFTTFVHFDR